MAERRPSIAVVGGGITGLATAYALRDRADITVLEASDRLGGKLQTEELDGITIELGPDSFLPRDETPLELCRSLGLGDELVEPADFGAWLWTGTRLVRLPEGFVLGLPATPLSILRSRVLSPMGAARAGLDLVLPGPLEGPDVSVAAFVRRRFGAQVLDRLVDPLMAGTRAGDVETMSLAAAATPVDQIARSHRSVTRGLKKAAKQQGEARPRFYGLRRGMTSLVTALERSLGDIDIIRSASVQDVEHHGDRYRFSAAGGSVVADGAVIAAPAHVAAGILRETAPSAARSLTEIEYASVATATFTYPAGSVRLPQGGSGFLVPRSAGRTIAGCTWFSRKWPHLAPEDGRVVIRCFAGRSTEDLALTLDDERLLARMREDLSDALGITTDPTATRLMRWPRAIPQLAVGHFDRMDEIERSLRSEAPGVVVAGTGYRGTGIPDCIAQAYSAADRVLADLGARRA